MTNVKKKEVCSHLLNGVLHTLLDHIGGHARRIGIGAEKCRIDGGGGGCRRHTHAHAHAHAHAHRGHHRSGGGGSRARHRRRSTDFNRSKNEKRKEFGVNGVAVDSSSIDLHAPTHKRGKKQNKKTKHKLSIEMNCMTLRPGAGKGRGTADRLD